MIVAAGASGLETHAMLGFSKKTPKEPGICSAPGQNLVRMVAGRDHALFLYEDGTVKGLGSNKKMQLGLKDRVDFDSPVDVTIPGEYIVDIAAASLHSALVTQTGRVFLLGKQKDGTSKTEPIHELPFTKKVIAVRLDASMIWTFDEYGIMDQYGLSNFYHHRTLSFVSPPIDMAFDVERHMVLLADGSVWQRSSWGDKDRHLKVKELQGKHVIKIVAGPCYSYGALCDDGTLYLCGNNDNGSLGICPGQKLKEFTLAAEDVVDFDCGLFHTVIIKKDGTAWATGLDNFGQLLVTRSQLESERKTWSKCELVQASAASVCCGPMVTYLLVNSTPLAMRHLDRLRMDMATKRVMLEDAYTVDPAVSPSVYSFGKNNVWQLGHDNFIQLLTIDASAIQDISAGDEHTIIHLSTGMAFAFGSDYHFQIGMTVGASYNSPALVKIGEDKFFGTLVCGPYYTAYVPSSNRTVVILCSYKYPGEPSYLVCEEPILQLVAGIEFPAAIDYNGDLWTFFDLFVRKVKFSAPLWDVGLGSDYIIAVTSEGHLYGNGALTPRGQENREEFHLLEDGVPNKLFARIIGHGEQTILIARDGSAYSLTAPETFTQIAEGIIDGDCGRSHAVLIKNTGELVTIGSGQIGQIPKHPDVFRGVGLVSCGSETTFVITNRSFRPLMTSIFDPKGCIADFAPLPRDRRDVEEVLSQPKKIELKSLDDINDLATLSLTLQENCQILQAACQAGHIDASEWQTRAAALNQQYLEKLRALSGQTMTRNFAKEIEQAGIMERPKIMQEAMQYFVSQMQSGAITPEQFQAESAKLTAALSVPAPDMPK